MSFQICLIYFLRNYDTLLSVVLLPLVLSTILTTEKSVVFEASEVFVKFETKEYGNWMAFLLNAMLIPIANNQNSLSSFIFTAKFSITRKVAKFPTMTAVALKTLAFQMFCNTGVLIYAQFNEND